MTSNESCSAHSTKGGVTFCNENLKSKSKWWLSYVLNEDLQVTAKSQAKLSSSIFFFWGWGAGEWLQMIPSQMHYGRKITMTRGSVVMGW